MKWLKWLKWLGPAIFAISLAVRLIGITWGLPNSLHNESYHPDEPINWFASQQVIPGQFKFTPGFYNYGTFFLTLSSIASSYCPPPESESPDAIPPWERCCLLAGRIVSALAGAGTAWVIFSILKRRTHMLGAAFGGLAAGLAPAFVVHSRFDTVDVTATFLFALSMMFALRLLPDEEGTPPNHFIRWALLAGMFAGLSAGTKYTGGVAIVGVLAAIVLTRGVDKARLAVTSIGAAALAFFISTPGVLLDRTAFVRDFAYEMAHVSKGHGLVFVNTPPAAIEHLISLVVGLGLLVFGLGIFGLLYAGAKRYQWAFIVLAFAIPYFLIISRGQVKFLRYTFPLYAPVCIGFGWLAGQAHRRRDGKGRLVVTFAIAGIGLQCVADNKFAFWMSGEDPRDEAGRFFKALARENPTITVGVTDDPWFYTPALYKDTAMTRPMWTMRLPDGNQYGPQKMSEAKEPRVVMFPADQNPEYVTYTSLKSFDLDRLKNAKNLTKDEQALVDKWKVVQERLEHDYKRLGVIGDSKPQYYREDLEYVHPQVFVWKRIDLP